jgi:hypothetical protein
MLSVPRRKGNSGDEKCRSIGTHKSFEELCCGNAAEAQFDVKIRQMISIIAFSVELISVEMPARPVSF